MHPSWLGEGIWYCHLSDDLSVHPRALSPAPCPVLPCVLEVQPWRSQWGLPSGSWHSRSVSSSPLPEPAPGCLWPPDTALQETGWRESQGQRARPLFQQEQGTGEG